MVTLHHVVTTCPANRAALIGSMKKDTSVNVRIESELREHLEELAKRDGRSLSNFIHRLLRAHADKHARRANEPEKKKR